MHDISYPIPGSCQCGHITYELLAPPLKVIACHCRECQKLSTSAFSLTAMVEHDALKVSGQLKHWERPSDSGNTNCAKFCPHCGNRIYHFNPDQPNIIKLKPSTLADTRIIQPTLHVWVSEKQDWFQIPEGVEQHPTQPW
ncbi:GFA family protein [Porticoccus sp.]